MVKSVLAMMDSFGTCCVSPSSEEGRGVTTGCHTLPLPGYRMVVAPGMGCWGGGGGCKVFC